MLTNFADNAHCAVTGNAAPTTGLRGVLIHVLVSVSIAEILYAPCHRWGKVKWIKQKLRRRPMATRNKRGHHQQPKRIFLPASHAVSGN
jgi:hypothetical protein